MANIKWWSNLMFLLNTKLRFAKSTLKLDTAHTVRGASSSMDHRTYQLSKLYLSSKHSHQKPKTVWSVSQAYSHLLQVPKIRRPNAKRTLCRKEKRCYLKQASSTSSTFLRASLLRMWARKARSQRPPRYKCNRSEELSTARCLSTASTSACRSTRRSCPCTTKSLLKRTTSRARSTLGLTSPQISSTWTYMPRHKNDLNALIK